MTEAEAIKELQYHIDSPFGIMVSEKTCKLAINALEKQIAKKPHDIDEREDDDFYYLGFMCPFCGGAITGQPYRPDYCKHCGQKLDWSEV